MDQYLLAVTMRRGPAPEAGISFILPHSLAPILPKKIMEIRELELFVQGRTAYEYTAVKS